MGNMLYIELDNKRKKTLSNLARRLDMTQKQLVVLIIDKVLLMPMDKFFKIIK